MEVCGQGGGKKLFVAKTHLTPWVFCANIGAVRACGLEFRSDTIHRIRQALDETPSISRRSLARRVCEWMDWRAASGRLKEAVCRKALAVLDEEGFIDLGQSDGSRGLKAALITRQVASIHVGDIACGLSELGGIEIQMVTSRYSKTSRIWKDLMDQHHYLGSGPLCGAQIRYLIHSSTHGCLGALSFSSAAWALKERDQFIGWTERARISNLQRVVCNSRFLIVPTVRVQNLASHILSQCSARIADDWMSCYGVEPVVLETFVDPRRFVGTSYRAANWMRVGKTSGRRATQREKGGGPKEIFLYPLRQDWQRILCEEPRIRLGQRPCASDPADWVEEEFGTVEFYDPRLKRRLFNLARDFYSQSQAPIPQSCGSHTKTIAAYRFFNNERVTMDKLLRAHTEASIERIKAHKVVLAVQDTTTLNYTAHRATEGLGPIGTKASGPIGLVVHDTMAFNTEGTPLGLLDVQCWARDLQDIGKKHRRKQLPIEEKESMKWLNSYRAVCEVQKLCPDTMLVSVGDRESDIYELFLEAAQNPAGPKILVRCERSRNRKTEEEYLWDVVARQPVAGYQVVRVPRRGCQLAREATLEVRHTRVVLKPPQNKDYPAVPVWMVYAREVDYSRAVKSPLEWMILTTVEVGSLEEACERLAWYAKRWGIEVFHRTLKSGCRIEDRQLGTAESLQACLAIDMVVAWRIYHLIKLGREVPDAPCTVFFEEAEWKALYIFIKRTLPSPDDEPTLREAIRMTASLGGFLGRKCDGEPGTTTLWRGLQRLEDITATYVFLLPHLKSGP